MGAFDGVAGVVVDGWGGGWALVVGPAEVTGVAPGGIVEKSRQRWALVSQYCPPLQSTFSQQSPPAYHAPVQHLPPVRSTHWWFDTSWHALQAIATHVLDASQLLSLSHPESSQHLPPAYQVP